MDSDILKVLTLAAVDVRVAGRVLGLGRDATYRAVHDGSLPTVKVGGRYRVPTAKLREMLALPPAPPPASIAA
ncbi:excisionase family DNA-binding protein [Methylobacterium sp. J-043]|nr:excisionase family DNA-binding protein [Methylobacterium sp. J-043]